MSGNLHFVGVFLPSDFKSVKAVVSTIFKSCFRPYLTIVEVPKALNARFDIYWDKISKIGC